MRDELRQLPLDVVLGAYLAAVEQFAKEQGWDLADTVWAQTGQTGWDVRIQRALREGRRRRPGET